MKTLIAAVVSLLLLHGCTPKPSPAATPLLTKTDNSATVTVCYPKVSNLVLKVQSVAVMVDDANTFFLHGGERITFHIPPGVHEIGVSVAFSDFFGHLESLPIRAEANASYFFETWPVFEGITLIPYGFIPLPGPDIRFRLFEVDEARAALLKTKPAKATERILPER